MLFPFFSSVVILSIINKIKNASFHLRLKAEERRERAEAREIERRMVQLRSEIGHLDTVLQGETARAADLKNQYDELVRRSQ